jgi:hypothetical protein
MPRRNHRFASRCIFVRRKKFLVKAIGIACTHTQQSMAALQTGLVDEHPCAPRDVSHRQKSHQVCGNLSSHCIFSSI